MKKYKELAIENINLQHVDYHIVGRINSFFQKDDLYIEVAGTNKLKIFLREIDFLKFERFLNELSKENKSQLPKIIFEQISSIKSYGIKGKKRNYTEFNSERKVKNRKQKEIKRGQYFYAKDHNFSKINNELPDKFVNRIIVGDSEEVLKAFPDNSIDIVFTSPPYNFGLEYSNSADDKDWQLYFDKLFRIFKEVIRVVKYGGRIIVNIQPLFSDYIPSHHIISNFFMEQKLIWKGEILWEKNNYNCKYTAWGSWKSPSNPYLKYTWEFLEIFAKGTLKKEGKKENIDILAEEFKKWVIAKWSIAPEKEMKKWGHPAMFPEKLVEQALKLFSYKNDIVLDPFNGVGTTTAVAKRLGRRYVGIDISEKYCEIAQSRTDKTKEEVKLF